VIAPLARWIILNHDWRQALLVLAVIALAVIVPGALLLRKSPETPRDNAPASGGTVATMSVAQAIRTPRFAAIALAHFMCCAAHSGPIFHMVPYAVDCGAVAMASTFGMAIGPWAGGWLFDHFGGYAWMYVGSFGLGLGAVAIAFALRPPGMETPVRWSPSAA
jgi:predicted MFS family arabinose efflux permease